MSEKSQMKKDNALIMNIITINYLRYNLHYIKLPFRNAVMH